MTVENDLAEPSGTPSAEGDVFLSESELGKAKADNLRLKQEVANLKGQNAKAASVVAAVAKLAQSGSEGRGIVEKLLRGEPLTASQETKAETVAEGYLTKAEMAKFLEGEFTPRMLEMLEERLYVADSAKEGRKELDSWAGKEYGELYDSIKGSTPWKRKLAKNVDELFDGVESGLYEVPAKFKGDVFKWAIDQSVAQVKADNPQLGKKSKVEPSKEEKEAAKRAVSTRSSGSSGETNEIPEELREEISSIRRIGTRSTTGRSWSRRETSAARR